MTNIFYLLKNVNKKKMRKCQKMTCGIARRLFSFTSEFVVYTSCKIFTPESVPENLREKCIFFRKLRNTRTDSQDLSITIKTDISAGFTPPMREA